MNTQERLALILFRITHILIPLQDCINRDSKRENPIGEKVITETYERYKSIIEGQNDTARNLYKS